MTTLKVGDKAPNFEALDQDGKTIKLKDYSGKKLVVFFYPKASTPGCTVEACNLRDNYQSFLAKGFDVLGVSADSAKRQQNFINKNEELLAAHRARLAPNHYAEESFLLASRLFKRCA